MWGTSDPVEMVVEKLGAAQHISAALGSFASLRMTHEKQKQKPKKQGQGQGQGQERGQGQRQGQQHHICQRKADMMGHQNQRQGQLPRPNQRKVRTGHPEVWLHR
jgi:hypothetical protein